MGRASETPEKLQAAFCQLMRQQGYGRVTIDAICKHAGVKKGSFYHAYPDKAALALEAFEYFWRAHSRPWMDGAFSPSSDPSTRLSNWLADGLIKPDDPDEVARDVLTLVEGALTQARISNSADPLRRLPSSVGRLIGATIPEASKTLTL